MIRLLITGATGFVGQHLIGRIFTSTDWDVVAMSRRPGAEPQNPRISWFCHDLLAPISDDALLRLGPIDVILHAGAEVSGINSLADPVKSVRTNVLGTYHLLEAARRLNASKFVYLSTGEAVGAVVAPLSLPESAPLRPSNPYAASKAAGEELCNAYRLSFGVPTTIVRSMNLFGPGQGFNRFVPMVARELLTHESVVCHVDRNERPGSRNWLHIEQFIEVLMRIVDLKMTEEIYHVVGPERDNLQIINLIAQGLGKEARIIKKIPGPSHDMRYALRDTRLGLDFNEGFEQRIYETARWYR